VSPSSHCCSGSRSSSLPRSPCSCSTYPCGSLRSVKHAHSGGALANGADDTFEEFLAQRAVQNSLPPASGDHHQPVAGDPRGQLPRPGRRGVGTRRRPPARSRALAPPRTRARPLSDDTATNGGPVDGRRFRGRTALSCGAWWPRALVTRQMAVRGASARSSLRSRRIRPWRMGAGGVGGCAPFRR
jgi:hypothetical protein